MIDQAVLGLIDARDANANGWHGVAFITDPTPVHEILAHLGESIRFPS